MGDDGSPFTEPTCAPGAPAPHGFHPGAKQVATGMHLARVTIPVLSILSM